MHRRAAELIDVLELRPHPEGGFYRELYRSASQVTTSDSRGERAAVTSIYFLLPSGHQSRWHRVASDEVWHLYEGGPVELLEIDAQRRELLRHTLGAVSVGATHPVQTIAAGNWQAARPLAAYALVGCTVAPGFEFADFELLADVPAEAAAVRAAWPDVASLV